MFFGRSQQLMYIYQKLQKSHTGSLVEPILEPSKLHLFFNSWDPVNMNILRCLIQEYLQKLGLGNIFTTLSEVPRVSGAPVFHAKLFNNPKNRILVKVNAYHDGPESCGALVEYFLGIEAINKLRYTLPTFMYTLAMFPCNPRPCLDSPGEICWDPSPPDHSSAGNTGILYEYIWGNTLNNLLYDEILNFEDWINIFAQILLSLEVAQTYLGN
jgi:hypothetical protein